jgi:hypothetical protein
VRVGGRIWSRPIGKPGFATSGSWQGIALLGANAILLMVQQVWVVLLFSFLVKILFVVCCLIARAFFSCHWVI